MAQGVSAVAPRPSTFASLKFRNFRLMWISLVVSNSCAWLESVAQDVILYEMTGKAVTLGIVAIVRAVALITLSFVGGTLADRVDRRKLLMVTQSLFVVTSFLLGTLAKLHMLQVWHVVAIAFVNAVLMALDQPARYSLVPDLVDRPHLMNAIALNSMTFTGSAAIGPALAVPLIKALGAPWGFYLNGISFLAVVWAVYMVQLPPTAPRKQTENVGQAITSGVRYVFATPPLLLVIGLLTVFAFFALPYQNLLAVVGYRLFGGPSAYGALRAAVGWGAVSGGFILARMSGYHAKDRLVTWGCMATSILLIIASMVKWLPASVVLFFGIGTAAQVYVSAIQTLMQQISSPQMRGRVMSLFAICQIAMWPLGTYPLSWLVDHIGIQKAFTTGATIPALILIFLMVTRGALFKSVRTEEHAVPAPSTP